jgi:endonuclease/exonuclease/phosphatase family metal-dependent hydrolase
MVANVRLRCLLGIVVYLVCLFPAAAHAEQARVHDCPFLFISWNVQDFGRSKSPAEISQIAEIINAADLVALQEVVAGKGFGAQAVAKLAETLSRRGSVWDYIVSDPTRPKSPGVECYAFLVKPSIFFSRRNAKLESSMASVVEREPYTFVGQGSNSEPILFFSFHAVPSDKQPENEARALSVLPVIVNTERVVIAGDFNVGFETTDEIFVPLGYTGHIVDETTLKKSPDEQGVYAHRQYDNIYTKGVTVCESGVIDFVELFYSPVTPTSLEEARKLSDHLPVYIWFK